MARTVRDARLDTREARSRLKPRHEPYWRTIEQGLHLGYRKGKRGGVWRVRLFTPAGYRKRALGTADDVLNADGLNVLSFRQAQDAARAWFEEQGRIAAGIIAPAAPYTVREAAEDYLAAYDDRPKAGAAADPVGAKAQTKNTLDVYVIPLLGENAVADLTAKQITDWHRRIARSPARLRSRRSAPARHASEELTAEAQRKRRVTANHVLTILKAALNHAWREGKVPSDTAWRKVKPFHNVDAPRIRYLTEIECVRLVNSCEIEFRPIVLAAILSGARYGELAAMKVADFNLDTNMLAARAGKGGKERHITLTSEGARFFADATAGRAPDAKIFKRGDSAGWGKNHQQRPLAEGCRKAKISPAISFHILRHTHGSILAMKGVPMAVISRQLGHASVRTTEKYYAHLAPNYVAETIRATFPDLGVFKKSNVSAMRRRSA